MGLVIRQSTFSTIFSYAGAIIGAVNTLWLFPKFLNLDDIGLYNVIVYAAMLFVPFAHLGLSQSVVKYFPKYKQTTKTRGHFLGFVTVFFISTFFIFGSLYFLFQAQLFTFFADKAPEIAEHSGLILTVIFLYAAATVYESYSRALLRIALPFFVKELLLRVLKAIWILLFAMGYLSFEQLLYSITFNYTIALIFIMIGLFMQGDIELSFEIGWIDKSFLKQFVRFSMYAMIGASGSAILFEIDSIMISGLLGLEATGIYTTVFFMAVMIEIPRKAISQISGALVSHSFQQERLDEIKVIYQKVSINQLVIGSFLFILLWTNIDPIFALIPQGERFAEGKWVVLILGIAKLIDMTASINSEIIVMSRYYRAHILMLLIMGASTICFNLWLIPIYGITGAAWATCITLVIFNISKLFFVWWKFRFQPLTFKSLIGVLPAGLSYVIVSLIPTLSNSLLSIILNSIAIVILFVSLTILLKPSSEINGIFVKTLTKFKTYFA